MKRQQRILFSALGVAVGGVSVGLFRVAELGVDPFQSLMRGGPLVLRFFSPGARGL